jgi:hypothetical protein
MRSLFMLLAFLAAFTSLQASAAGHGRVVKVLPFLLDRQGNDATSPSLFDRDAYQARLRDHKELVSGMRFDVQSKLRGLSAATVRVELRGVNDRGLPQLKTLETSVKPGYFHQWTTVSLTGDAYKQFGGIVAWRVTLWDGDQLLSEQKSFLW